MNNLFKASNEIATMGKCGAEHNQQHRLPPTVTRATPAALRTRAHHPRAAHGLDERDCPPPPRAPPPPPPLLFEGAVAHAPPPPPPPPLGALPLGAGS